MTWYISYRALVKAKVNALRMKKIYLDLKESKQNLMARNEFNQAIDKYTNNQVLEPIQ